MIMMHLLSYKTMKQNIIAITSAGLGGLLSFLYGDITPALQVLVAMMVIDFVTGTLNGVLSKKLNSKTCYKGIVKKINILCLVAVGHFIDQATGMNTIKNVVVFFYLANEGISIIENAAKAGLPIPQKIKDVLEQLKEEGGQK